MQRRDGSFVAPNVVFGRMPTTLQKQFDGCAQKLFFEAHQIRNSTAKKGRMLLPLSCGKLGRTSAEKVRLVKNLLMSVVV
jgi:hypothetical protein